MNEWITDLKNHCATGEPAVIVTVAGIRGSAPREIGAKMIVTSRQTLGTIGGGQLEYQCTRLAVDMLGKAQAVLRKFPLGSSMGQCCGGVVEILFEPLSGGMPAWLRDLATLHGEREAAVVATVFVEPVPFKVVVTARTVLGSDGREVPQTLVARARSILSGARQPLRSGREFYEPVVMPDLNIAVFGAGHVGTAVVHTLAALDCVVRWVDSRRAIFRQVPHNVRAIETPDPALEVAAMPPEGFYLVMTHSHGIDFEICERALRRGDARYCGLIGSLTKRRRFEKRFRQQGISQAVIDTLVCPIGIDGVSGKKPAEIAVATAAEILQVQGRAAGTGVDRAAQGHADNVHPLR